MRQAKIIKLLPQFLAFTIANDNMSDIKIVSDKKEIIVNMYDNPTSQSLILFLPLRVKFEDYAKTEKIANLLKKLSIKEAPTGAFPKKGDFAYYAPWGNLAIFYKDFSYSNGLIILGHIEEGLEDLDKIGGYVEIQKNER
ncbi:MAG: hypothetical protein LBJ88_00385 [Campylobacteraceae bacterium]|jgi:hypothetical protein|nr:hypothetical protein [Campylobacteraceae bacterium]